MITRFERNDQMIEAEFTPAPDSTSFGEELSPEMLELVAGGMRPNEVPKTRTCKVNGPCWTDTNL